MTIDEKGQRARFEDWYSQKYLGSDVGNSLDRYGDGYNHLDTHFCWLGWQAYSEREQAKPGNVLDVFHTSDEKPRKINEQGGAGDVRVLHVTTTDQFPEAGKMVEAGHSEQQLDMVERVAKAIQKSGHVEVDALTLQQLGIKPLEWTDFVEDAKAAIAAVSSAQVQLGSELNLSEELSEANLVAWFEANNFLLNEEAERAARALKQIADIRRKP